MITVEKNEDKLILIYIADYAPWEWLRTNLEIDANFTFKSIFTLNRSLLLEHTMGEDIDNPEFHFIIGELEGEYFKIDKSVFNLKNDFYFFQNLEITEEYFLFPRQISILKYIDRNVSESVYIGGNQEGILPLEDFKKLLVSFPNSYEINLYREAKITAILGDFFSGVPDKERKYHNYINKKTSVKQNQLRKTFKDSEIAKYETLFEKLNFMLQSEKRFSENQWQEEILQIMLLLFPKYVTVFKEVTFEDIYSGKKRRLDYGLIDFNGNLDLMEIKTPFDKNKNIISKTDYRGNHLPNRDLAGAIMQIEKYIFYLNKLGKKGEKKLTEKYKEELPDEMEIQIVNPNGIIIMGRDNFMESSQLRDFEIIKRKYKNVVDIFTYDDLLRRLEVTINQLKKI